MSVSKEKLMIISHNGSWFKKPNTIVRTDQIFTPETDVQYMFETSVEYNGNILGYFRNELFVNAITRHKLLSAKLGLKQRKPSIMAFLK